MSDERTAQRYDQDFVNTVKTPGRYNFGDGLFLDVKPIANAVGKYWVWAYNGKTVGEGPRERIGIGVAKTMPLKVARRESLLLDQVLESGRSPKVHREQMRMTTGDGIFTFKQAVEGFYEVCDAQRWHSKHSRGMGKTIKNNYLLTADCAKLPLQAINHLHIEAILMQRVHPYFDTRGRRRHFEINRLIALDKERPGLSDREAAKILKSERHTVGQYRKMISSGAATPRLRLREATQKKLDDDLMGPLWIVKPDIGKRVQCFLNGMFRHWKARGKFKGDNPADRSSRSSGVLNELLPAQPKGGNHQDLRVDELPPLVAFLHKPQRAANLITTDQLATALGISPIAIRNARKRHGLIGHREPGRMWKNASYVYDIAEAERVFKRKIPPVTMRADEDLYANILEMIILTLARSDMICKLRWDEIKPRYQNSVMGMIIYENHKTYRYGYTYGSVITPRIRAIFDAEKKRHERLKIDSPYVFAHGPVIHGVNRWLNLPSNPNTMEKCLRRCLAQIDCIETKDATVHGMRTAFSTWACDIHEYEKDMAMITIGHKLKRPDADIRYLRNVRKLHQRYEMMTAWGDYCLSQVKRPLPQDDKVVKLSRPSR